jgi:hypothetical protein
MKTFWYLFQGLTVKKILHKVLWFVWKLMGFIPYLVLTDIVNIVWSNQFGLPIPPGNLISAFRLLLDLQYILYTLAVVGSWTMWVIFCKVLKYTLMWTLTEFGAI